MTGAAIVVGAGVVGSSAALALQRDGWSVRLLDPEPAGTACSAGNAGHLGTASVLPMATPQQIRALPQLLRRADGPLAVHWPYVLRNLPWFVRFVANGRRSRMEANARALAALLEPVPQDWAALAASVGAQDLIARRGLLHVWAGRAAYLAAQWAYDLRRRFGIRVDDLDAARARAAEPALAGELAGARLLPDVACVIDPLELTSRIVAAFRAAGGRCLQQRVSALARLDHRVVGVQGSEGELQADLVVLAAGAWSQRLSRGLGVRVPIVAERGYNVTLAPGPGEPSLPLLLAEPRIAVSPMAAGLRMTTMAEFAPPDAAPDDRRADLVFGRSSTLLPHLSSAVTQRWVGARPSTPDSLPIVGRAPNAANVLLAYGHGHLGLTLAASTAQAIADLAGRRQAPAFLSVCSPARSIA
jgi:glycine/D-amino acid oxidase-like deaminating enzyme